jgi:methionyl-tRNA synthetase
VLDMLSPYYKVPAALSDIQPCLYCQGNYFFRLSRYQKEIEELLIGNEDFVQPAARRNEVHFPMSAADINICDDRIVIE